MTCAKVFTMTESNGRVTHSVFILDHESDRPWDGVQVYSSPVKGRAEYHAAELEFFFGNSEKEPFILDFDTDMVAFNGPKSSINLIAEALHLLPDCAEKTVAFEALGFAEEDLSRYEKTHVWLCERNEQIDQLETRIDQLEWENKGVAEWRDEARHAMEAGKKDYADMRKFQAKFIMSDHALRSMIDILEVVRDERAESHGWKDPLVVNVVQELTRGYIATGRDIMVESSTN